ncbi:MAG: hypothetical protein AAFY11_07795 [Cyanobacteria bacterium J06641_5]
MTFRQAIGDTSSCITRTGLDRSVPIASKLPASARAIEKITELKGSIFDPCNGLVPGTTEAQQAFDSRSKQHTLPQVFALEATG